MGLEDREREEGEKYLKMKGKTSTVLFYDQNPPLLGVHAAAETSGG